MADIRFLHLASGTTIAFTIMGQGPLLVFAPAAVTHLGATLDNPAMRKQLDVLAESFTVIMFDRWGNGLSDRYRDDWTLDAETRVLGEVADVLKLESFALVGISGGGPASALYASRHPERVNHLILYATFANRPELTPAVYEPLFAFIHSNWGMAAGAVAQAFVPDLDSDHLKWFLRLEREGADGEAAERTFRMEMLADVRAEVRQLVVPTLVIHRRDDLVCPFSAGRDLAGYIPGARFLPLPGDQHYWFRGDAGEVVEAIREFVLPTTTPAGSTEAVAVGQTVRTLLFTDLEAHTPMMQRLGDVRGREVLREHDRLTRDALAAHGGTEVKSMGDGFLASFGSAQKALECAIAVQRAFAKRDGEPLSVRIGINAGEPVQEDDDVFGSSVIATARIAGLAAGGHILVSDVVRQLVAGKGFLFSDTGERILRGMEEPVHVWELRWAPESN